MIKSHKKILIIIFLLVALALITLLLRSNEDTWVQEKNGNWVKHGNPVEVADFDTCAKFFPILETYPEQCRTPDGKTFTKSYNFR